MTFVLFGKPTETKELQVVFYQLLAMILGGALGNRSQIEHQWDDDLHMLCWLLNLQFFFGVIVLKKLAGLNILTLSDERYRLSFS